MGEDGCGCCRGLCSQPEVGQTLSTCHRRTTFADRVTVAKLHQKLAGVESTACDVEPRDGWMMQRAASVVSHLLALPLRDGR